MIYAIEYVLGAICVLFESFVHICTLAPYTYMYLRIGPATEELIEDQEYQEAQEFFEEPPSLRPSLLLSPIDITC